MLSRLVGYGLDCRSCIYRLGGKISIQKCTPQRVREIESYNIKIIM